MEEFTELKARYTIPGMVVYTQSPNNTVRALLIKL